MQSYKLTVAYDGTDYHGWQWQPHQRSVDRVLREAFLKTFNQTCMLVGASRTDAGVHAAGQVVRIKTDLVIEPQKLRWILNNALPEDIVITDLVLADPKFHPQHTVALKTYHYTFFTQRPSPTVQRFGTFIQRPIDFEKLSRALTLFLGEHDFRAYCKEVPEKNTVKTINAIALFPCEKTGGVVIKITGKSFLRFMIRRIVGAAFAAATQPTVQINDLKRALFEKKMAKVLPTAPAKGLCLMQIDYYQKMEDLI